MNLKKNTTIFLLSNIIMSATLLAQDSSVESIGMNIGYAKMFYTGEKIDIDKPKTIFYNIELYSVINHFFENNNFKPTFNYIYSKNDAIDSNSIFVGLNRYDNFEKFDFYTGILLGYSEFKWNFNDDEKNYSKKGPTGGLHLGIEFPFSDALEFNINTKYLLYQRKVNLQPQYDVKFTHTGTLSLSFGLKYIFGRSMDKDTVDIYHIETDDGLLDIEVPSVNLDDIVTINQALTDSTDSDGDGIPDMLDNCSDSVKGEIVDELGCAKDSDDDFVIDRLDKCPNSIEDEIVDKDGCAKDSDNDKIADRLDSCPNSVVGEIVNEFGCAKDSDNDAVVDRLDRCPNSLEYVIVDDDGCMENIEEDKKKIVKTAIINKKNSIDMNISKEIVKSEKVKKNLKVKKINKLKELNKVTIRFAYKSEDLAEKSQLYLQSVIENLKKFPKHRIVLKSFTDSIGSKRYNLKLSEKRSQTVLQILKKAGIDSSRVMVYNMGESSPIASNMLKAGREKNRRIEIKIISL